MFTILCLYLDKVAQVLAMLVLGLLVVMLGVDVLKYNDHLTPYSICIPIIASCIILFIIRLLHKKLNNQ